MLTSNTARTRRQKIRDRAATRPKRGSPEARRDYEAVRRTTDQTCELLEDIRNMTQDPLNFVPGHRMKPVFQLEMEAELAEIKARLGVACQKLMGER